MKTTQELFERTAADITSREVMTVPRETSLPVADRVRVQAQSSGAPMVGSEERRIGVFSKADRARRTQLEKRVAQRAPTVPGCVCSDWQVVKHDWDTPPAESVNSDMTMDPVSVPPEIWIG